jgi:hypothetical protein
MTIMRWDASARSSKANVFVLPVYPRPRLRGVAPGPANYPTIDGQ